MSGNFVLNKDSDFVAECFSAHYTNIFLIYLYEEARKYVKKESNIPSLTEGYKTALAAYNNAMSRDDFVKQTLNGIYNQFVKIDKTMRIRECTNKILSTFYPEDGYSGIIKQEKYIECAISKIIHDITKLIIYTVPVNHAKSIIDNNSEIKTQLKMQDEFKEIVIELMERNHIEYFNKKKSQYHNPDTNYSMFEKAKGELARVSAEKSEIEARYNAQTNNMRDLQNLNNELREKVGNQQNHINELEQKIRHQPAQPQPTQYSQMQPQQSQYSQMQPQPTQYSQPSTPSRLVQTAPMPTQYNVIKPQEATPSRPKRDLSYLINNDDSDDELTVSTDEPKKNLMNRLQIDDDEINLDMFTS